MRNKSRAFTLIELLVVVLIIGILAAVAVPQYQVAVKKSKFTNMRSVARSYVRAAEAYYLEQNAWPTTFAELAIDIPGGTETINTALHHSCYTNEQMYCCLTERVLGNQDAKIICGENNYDFAYYFTLSYINEGCVAKSDSLSAKQMCSSVTGKKTGVNTNATTPTGHKTGYMAYVF